MSPTRFLSRETLGLEPPRSPLSPFSQPADRLFFHHSVTPSYGSDYRRAAQTIQRVAFERGFSDASYGVGIVPDGTVLELRGFDWIGAHTVNDAGFSYNPTSHAIVFVGNYEEEPLTHEAQTSAQIVVALLRAGGKLLPFARLDPHQAVRSTACPGRNVVAALPMLRVPYKPTAIPLPDRGGPEMFIVRCPSLPAGHPPILVGSNGKGVQRIASQTIPAYAKAGVPVVTLDEGEIPNDVAADEYAKFEADLD